MANSITTMLEYIIYTGLGSVALAQGFRLGRALTQHHATPPVSFHAILGAPTASVASRYVAPYGAQAQFSDIRYGVPNRQAGS